MTTSQDKLFFLRAKFGRKKSNLPNASIVIFIGVIILFGLIDFLVLYSAANGHADPWARKQFYTFCVMMVFMFVIQNLDLKSIYFGSYKLYALIILLLLIAEMYGHSAMGAQRWFKIWGLSIQPSELMKLGVILALSRYFHDALYAETQKIQYLLLPILLLSLPTFLILRQPNLGTSIILVLVGASIFFASGIKKWLFISPILLLIALAPFIWHFALHNYQKQRILTFLDPESDILGAGYNIAQSKIAIGSGGVYGKGFMGGSQSQLNFLPEKHTDFALSMIAEEWGFIGSIIILFLYFTLFIICYRIAINTTNQFGRLVVLGVTTMLFVHVFVNIAMISGIIPVVGTPLPLLSYGGSNLATSIMGLGLVLNVNAHKKENLIRSS